MYFMNVAEYVHPIFFASYHFKIHFFFPGVLVVVVAGADTALTVTALTLKLRLLPSIVTVRLSPVPTTVNGAFPHPTSSTVTKRAVVDFTRLEKAPCH